QAEDGIRDFHVTGVQTCALPIYAPLPVLPGEIFLRVPVLRLVIVLAVDHRAHRMDKKPGGGASRRRTDQLDLHAGTRTADARTGLAPLAALEFPGDPGLGGAVSVLVHQRLADPDGFALLLG